MMKATCGTWPYLPSWAFESNSRFWFHKCCLSIFLILIGSQNILVFSTYLYFVGIWLPTRLHQSNRAHSTTCRDVIICKYQIPSSIICCNLQKMNTYTQW